MVKRRRGGDYETVDPVEAGEDADTVALPLASNSREADTHKRLPR